MRKLLERIRKILRDRRTRRLLTRTVSISAAIVVFVTTYALVLPAITMEIEAQCGLEAHQHDDSCYEKILICGLEESPGHIHTDACYSVSPVLMCVETEHTHSVENGCFDGEGDLICEKIEHTHSDDCYKEERTLTCGLEESEGHHHTDACYDKVLTCKKEVHVHSAACYQTDPVEESAVAASTSSTFTASAASAMEISSSADSAAGTAGTASPSADNEDSTDEGVDYGFENAGDGLTETPAAAMTDADSNAGYIPQLDPLDFNTVLNSRTGIYYHPVADGEVIEDSTLVPADGWIRIPNTSEQNTSEHENNVTLGRNDLLRVYLAYTIPAGALNSSNPAARYRLPGNIHLTDTQVKAINENVNGIAGKFISSDTLEITDKDKYYMYLGAEAVEGERRPDQDISEYLDELSAAGKEAAEYISATVKVENIFDKNDGSSYERENSGQDLVFTFTPYSIEKNQHSYDSAGKLVKAGEDITGWLTFDFNIEQVDWSEKSITGEETVDSKDASSEGSKEKTAANTIEADETLKRSEQTADIVFVEDGFDDQGNRIREISTRLSLSEEAEEEAEEETEEEKGTLKPMPAASFVDSIRVTTGRPAGIDDETSGGTLAIAADALPEKADVFVRAEADEGTFPAGTTMVLKAVDWDSIEKLADTLAETVENSSDAAGGAGKAEDKGSHENGKNSDSVKEQTGQKSSKNLKTYGFQAVDITFVDSEGNEIEPAKPVHVVLTSTVVKQVREDARDTVIADPVVVHVDDNGKAEQMDLVEPDEIKPATGQAEEELQPEADVNAAVGFTTNSFSVYAIVYTVDFHYEINGKIFDFSIPGGGFVSLEHVVEILGIADNTTNTEKTSLSEENGRGSDDENENVFLSEAQEPEADTGKQVFDLNNVKVSETAKKFVADVESVEFSTPSLVWTGKVDKETTVGKLKEEHDLNVQYSAELPEELIAEWDSCELESGDWALISLLPFDTEEKLTVTMKNGEVWEIAVTDANVNARKASLISASSIVNNQNLVIYQKVIQPDDSILYYAIDGNGNLQRVYNSSDSVYWLNDPPIVWKVRALSDGAGTGTGYYTLYNEATGNYLVPKDDNGSYKVVHKLSDFSDGDEKHLQISLPGKEAGKYLSKIASWDYSSNVTYGMEVLGSTDIHAKELLSSQDFFFATPDEIVQGRLTTVDTVDSLSKGIKITMYDFTGTEWQIDPKPRLSYMTRIIGDSSYTEGVYHPNLVKPVLGADGFPVSTATGQSIKPVFQTQGNYYSNSSSSWNTPGTFNYSVSQTNNVNHLFLQSVYDATGYFYYSCFENYARLNGSNFDVYEQLGAPWDGEEFFFHRGNFTPYNSLDLSHILSNNTSSSSSSPLGSDDPRKGEDLYVINGDADYYFGMIMESDFLQGLNGYNDRDEPTVYEFNGDDDLWIYIDNALVLDIGGVHDAFQGRIDFSTGAVTITNGTSTTIRQMFRDAGRFPDGTPWNDSRVNEYFKGDTFKDYSTHTFKMFYMERGAAASNLEMKFNLMPVHGSSFRVTKQIPETASGDVLQNDYADAVFYYRAYIGTDVCTRAAFGSTAKYADGTPVIWKDSTTFQLKHGQTAIFPVDSNTVRYHVEEVEPESGSNMLSHYYVTNSDPEPGQGDGHETVSAEKSVQQRGEVVFTNKPDDSIVNELRIVKNLTGDMYTDDQGNLLVNEETGSPYFEYRIYLENTAGKLVYYSLGEYYQTDINGNYVYYESGQRKTAEYRDGKYIYTYNDGTVVRLDKPRITEHTSQNGSIGDIRHGDTVIIRGLLEGTDFVVDERTDRSLMIKGTAGEDTTEKYSFDGTTVEDAYIRATGENRPEYPTGTLYDPPSAPDAPYSSKAAEGTIIQEKDARVTVKNSSQLINPDLSLKKTKEDGTPLAGAVFKLMKGQGIVPVALSGEGVVIEPLTEGETVTISDNTFTLPSGGVMIKNIPSDKTEYTLVEVSAPDGYVITQPEVATFKAWSGDIEITGKAEFTDNIKVAFNEELNILTVPNLTGTALPNTGGPGTHIFTILGSILILGAGALLSKRRRWA